MSLYFFFIYLFFKAVTLKQPHSRLAQKLRANIKYPPHNVQLITKPIETPHSRLQAGNPSSLSSHPTANFLFLRLIGNKRNIIVLRSLPTTQSSNNKETKCYIVFTRLIKKALDPRNPATVSLLHQTPSHPLLSTSLAPSECLFALS